MSPSVDSPQVVVGIGGSGIDIIDRLQQTVRKEGYDRDEFLFFGVDSRDIKYIEEIERWDQQTTTLSWKERKEWDEKFKNYHFLQGKEDIPPEEGGVQRDRALARGLIDDVSNINRLISGLSYSITNFEDEFNSNTLDVWVVNSLGGGTGSGMFPLVLGLIQWLEPAEFDSNINLHGILSLPQLDLDSDARFLPNIDSRAVPNSFAALTEMRDLLDVAESDVTEVDIELQHDISKVDLFKALRDNRTPVERSHFEEVYLMGIDEEKISQDSGGYAARVEQLATNTILGHAVAEENFPDPGDPSLEERILHTNDIVELRFPYETTAEFVKLEAKSISLDDDKDALTELTKQYASNREFVKEAVTIQEGSDIPVISALSAYCDSSVSAIDEGTFQRLDKEGLQTRINENISLESDEAENLQSEFDQTRKYREAVSKVRRPPRPGSWMEGESDSDDEEPEATSPEQALLRHLAYTAAKERAKRLRSGAQLDFEDALDRLWNEIRDDLDEATIEDYRSYDNDPKEQWEIVVSAAASRRIQDLREGGLIRTYDDEADELAELRDDVERQKTRVEDFSAVIEALDDLSDDTVGNLRNLIEWYDNSIESIDGTIERIGGRQTTLGREREEKREILTSASYVGSKYATMAIENPDSLIDEYFSAPDTEIIDRLDELVEEYNEDGSDNEFEQYRKAAEQYLRATVDISECNSKGIIGGEELYNGARSLLENIEERVADEGTMQDGIVLPIMHPEDDWLDVMGQDDYKALITGVDGNISNCEISDERGYCGDRGLIRFLYSNPNVTLSECSEYQTLKQWYDDGTLMDVLETEADTPEEAVNFAYPELVSFLSKDEQPPRPHDE